MLYHKTRVDYSDGTKNFYFTQPNGAKGVKGIHRVPYNLPAIATAQTIYFVEGEKCADAVIKTGCVATTLDSGAKSKWWPDYASYFTGKTIIIIPDNDAPGMEYAQRIAQQIPGSWVIPLPGLTPKQDIYDWLHAGHTMDEIDNLPPIDQSQIQPSEPAEAGARPPDLSDTGNAEVFERLYSSSAIWTRGGGWFVWDGTRWEQNDSRAVSLVRELSGQMLHEALADFCEAQKRVITEGAGERESKALVTAKA